MKTPARRWLCLGLSAALLLGALGCGSKSKPKEENEEEARKRRRGRQVLLTTQDDIRTGREGAEAVAAQIGVLDDPELTAYVEGIGKKLLRGLPRRDFAYRFAIVDQMEPNAFALPGGFIFVSRGLLAAVNNEDELANVLGHEIVHSARRHSAQQQAVRRQQSSFSLPFSRARELAAYGRDMEREADALGQKLAAAAGYDPMGMSTFMRRLDQRERMLIGAKRRPTFMDTHPGTRERAATNAMRSGELRWTRDPSLGDTRVRLLDHTDGMIIGDRPETGVFIGELFLHPDLGFEMQFPRGWRLQNTSQAVAAAAPRNAALIYLTADQPAGDLVERADEFAKKTEEETGISVNSKKRVRLGPIPAVRYGFAGKGVEARVTFFPFRDATWRIVGVSAAAAADRYIGPILLSTRSFRHLSSEHRDLIKVRRMRVVLARRGEDLRGLGARTGNEWSPGVTAVINGKLGNETFDGGEYVKILRSEPYLTPASS